jgi:SH3-like domain-containing protein
MGHETVAPSELIHVKGTKLRVKAPHKASFEYSVVFKKGDKVRIAKEDPEMPGWFWCKNKDGLWSWIPQEYLARSDSEGTITHSYDTTELTVAVGEILEHLREVSFWTFCRTSDGRKGWVPTKNLESVSE